MTRRERLLLWGHWILTGHERRDDARGRCRTCERDRGLRRIGGGAW